MPYDYEGRVDFRGNAAKALEFAGEQLVAKGLNVLPLVGNQLHFEHAVSFLTCKKEPLRMVSKGIITVAGPVLTLRADLDNIRALKKLLVILLALMAVLEVALMAVVFDKGGKQPQLLLLCVLNIAALVIAPPLIAKFQKAITSRALGVLLNGAAKAGEQKS